MHPYSNSLAGVTAGFPGAVYTPVERLNARTDYAERTETGTVPGAGNEYAVELDYAILEAASLTITDTTSSTVLVVIPWGLAPAAGEASVHHNNGWVRVHSSRTGHGLSVVYKPLGSAETARLQNLLQKELAAVQWAVGSPAQVVRVAKSGGDYTTVQGALDAITDAGASKPYRVDVYPGVYVEQFVPKDYVTVAAAIPYTATITYEGRVCYFPSAGITGGGLSGLIMTNTETLAHGSGAGGNVVRSRGVVSGWRMEHCVLLSTAADGIDALIWNATAGGADRNEIKDCVMSSERDPFTLLAGGTNLFVSGCRLVSWGTSMRSVYLTGAASELLVFNDCVMEGLGTTPEGVRGISPAPTNVIISGCHFVGIASGSEIVGLTPAIATMNVGRLKVQDTTMVPGLNADTVDGSHASAFLLAAHPKLPTSAPSSPVEGSCYWDSTNKCLRVWNDTAEEWWYIGACAAHPETMTVLVFDNNIAENVNLTFANGLQTSAGGCFPASAAVLMADGSTKSIADVAVGDLVMCKSPRSGMWSTGRVEAVKSCETEREFVSVNAGAVLLTPSQHLHVNGQPLTAGHVRGGDRISGEHGPLVVETVGRVPCAERVYDLRIDGAYQTYIVNGVIAYDDHGVGDAVS